MSIYRVETPTIFAFAGASGRKTEGDKKRMVEKPSFVTHTGFKPVTF